MKKLFLACTLLFATIVVAQEQPSGISVNGEGTVKVVPDEVLIQVNVNEEAQTAKEVKASTDEVIDAVLKYLKKEGIDKKNIQTEYIRLAKSYKYDTKTYLFQANQSISILLTDVSQYDKITQGLLELGINGINSVQFKSSEMEKYESQARIKAIKNAKAKAEEYAEALGVKVGAPIFISESSTGNYPQPQMMRMVDMKESSASGNQTLAVGEMEIMAQVTVNFAIIQ
ncbi:MULTISPECIES: SIMPL domain-containing protein [Mesonia]|uniref:26 kDa periplasmic immunogenic protein n=1 Tax=Mesonia oceanica TaxID=2687242 RepID=A0AC61Y7K8_9FLAO|nr:MULTISPECIES: SIMPL domain-containing protein [Mesonia]MAN28342.1 SIMPL domain-containing protein [Mesonia sp.]VVV00175.1 26 kDa periplasmic immunogenic protein [Mesonia oceanica]|tara:strand:- start:31587 stop:32270 length:684 start_codon:yes stop_codon:yes gene_type:complete